MSVKDTFDELIKEGKLSKAVLLDMLENIKARNTDGLTIITDEEYNAIKSRIEQLPN